MGHFSFCIVTHVFRFGMVMWIFNNRITRKPCFFCFYVVFSPFACHHRRVRLKGTAVRIYPHFRTQVISKVIAPQLILTISKAYIALHMGSFL